METITLEVNNKEDLEMILLLAKRLRCRVIRKTLESPNNSEVALEHLRRISENGGLRDVIPDPVAWQKEIRTDRILPGRD
jgi:hypothetical protein